MMVDVYYDLSRNILLDQVHPCIRCVGTVCGIPVVRFEFDRDDLLEDGIHLSDSGVRKAKKTIKALYLKRR